MGVKRLAWIIVLTLAKVLVLTLVHEVQVGGVPIARHLVVENLQAIHVRLVPMIAQVHVKIHVKKTVKNHVRTHVKNHVRTHVKNHVRTHVKNHAKTRVLHHVKAQLQEKHLYQMLMGALMGMNTLTLG